MRRAQVFTTMTLSSAVKYILRFSRRSRAQTGWTLCRDFACRTGERCGNSAFRVLCFARVQDDTTRADCKNNSLEPYPTLDTWTYLKIKRRNYLILYDSVCSPFLVGILLENAKNSTKKWKCFFSFGGPL